MPTVTYAGHDVTVNDEGFLTDPGQWTEEMAPQIASAEGIGELRGGAAASPFPPSGYTVETGAAVAGRRAREELLRAHPELAPWVELRSRLEAVDGEIYFNQTLRTGGVPRLKGTLIRFEPAVKPKLLVLGISDPGKEEVVLQLEEAFANEAPAGTQIEFAGRAAGFSREPFRLVLDVDREAIEGWPAPARARRKR